MNSAGPLKTMPWPAWGRTGVVSPLITVLLLVMPAAGRERKVIQKRITTPIDLQLRAADNWIGQSSGQQSGNNGAASNLTVRSQTGNLNQRALVLFDLSSVAGSGIKLATLTLFMDSVPSTTQSRTYDASRVTSFWTELDSSWVQRVPGVNWSTAGGDVDPASSSATTPTSPGPMSWDVTGAAQQWMSGQSPNYGLRIAESMENSTANSNQGFTGQFSSKEDLLDDNHPELTVEFIQNVSGLTAAAGNGSVTLSWSYPATVGTVVSPTVGVLILRQAGAPIASTMVPNDGTTYTTCSTIGGATVVFVNGANATNFVDNGACGLANETTYYYKVFTVDMANNYSSNGNSSSGVAEAMATPSATAPQSPLWMMTSGAATLAPPGLSPGVRLVVGSNSNFILGSNAADGSASFAPVATGGAVSGRPSLIDLAYSSNGHNASYVACQDNFVYAMDRDTGALLWLVNPTGLSTNSFQGAAAVWVKSFSGPGYSLPHDLVILGTDNAANPGLSRIVAIDANNGATVWQVTGGSGGNKNMDIVNSTPLIDYVHSVLWVTSREAGQDSDPNWADLWKINPNTGQVIASVDLNGDIDSSPSMSPLGDFLFVGNNAGELRAINPGTVSTIDTYSSGDGAVRGFPVVLGFSAPYTIIFATDTRVWAVSFDGANFASLWSTAIASPSALVGVTGLSEVYVGSSDGKLHQLRSSDGVDEKQRAVGSTVGDPSLDIVLSRIYVGSANGRVYAFAFPF